VTKKLVRLKLSYDKKVNRLQAYTNLFAVDAWNYTHAKLHHVTNQEL